MAILLFLSVSEQKSSHQDFDYKILENWNKQTNGFETFLYRQLIG